MSIRAFTEPAPTPAGRAQQQVDEWNRRYPVGTRVFVDVGELQVEAVTTHRARVVLNRNAVVWVSAIQGYRLLSQVHPIEENHRR